MNFLQMSIVERLWVEAGLEGRWPRESLTVQGPRGTDMAQVRPGPHIAGRRSEKQVSHMKGEDWHEQRGVREKERGEERKKQRSDSEVFGWDLSAWWLVGFSSDFLTLINTPGN